jgi:hypothetical protein
MRDDAARPLGTNRQFKFHKRGQLFIRSHNETLSVAMGDSRFRLVR